MPWSERQLAMLREMGIRVWSREASGAEGMATAGGEALVAEEPRPLVEEARTPVTAPVVRHQAARDTPTPRAPTPKSSQAPVLVGAEWLVVGEPFDAIGNAGDPSAAADQERLLDNMLHAIRVSRAAPGREGRACYLPIAEGQAVDSDAAIARVGPRCILALGRVAANTLLGVDEQLGRLRGRLHERAGVPVVVTYTLPYLLRQSPDKAGAWADLCRAVKALGQDETAVVEPPRRPPAPLAGEGGG